MLDAPRVPIRRLVINITMSLFISCVVFAVLSYKVLVPQMARQQLQILELQAKVVDLQGQLDEATAAPDVPDAPSAAAVPPAGAPASAGAPVPAAPSGPVPAPAGAPAAK